MSTIGALLISRRVDGEFNARIRDVGEQASRALAILAERMAADVEALRLDASGAPRVLQLPHAEFGRGADNHERIFSATLAVLAEEGYGSATIARITKRAGVSSSSIYWLFPSKDELVQRAIEWASDDWYSTVPACLPRVEATEWTTHLADQIDRYLASNLTSPHFILGGLQLTLDTSEDGDPPSALVLYRDIRAVVRARMAEWLNQVALDGSTATMPQAETLALLAFTLMDETFSQFSINHTQVLPRRHVRLIVRLLEALAGVPVAGQRAGGA